MRHELTSGSLTAVKPYSAGFKAVGSTATVDARDHLGPCDDSFRLGVAVYWLD